MRSLRPVGRDVVRRLRGHDVALYAAGLPFYGGIAVLPTQVHVHEDVRTFESVVATPHAPASAAPLAAQRGERTNGSIGAKAGARARGTRTAAAGGPVNAAEDRGQTGNVGVVVISRDRREELLHTLRRPEPLRHEIEARAAARRTRSVA